MISLKNTLSAIGDKIKSHEKGRDFAVVTRWTTPGGDTTATVSLAGSLTAINPYMTNIYQSVATEGSWTANSTGIYVPHDGYVVVKASVYFLNGTSGAPKNGVYVFKNGSEITNSFEGYTDKGYQHISYPIAVSAGDYITIKARSSFSSGTVSAALDDRASWISVEYV